LTDPRRVAGVLASLVLAAAAAPLAGGCQTEELHPGVFLTADVANAGQFGENAATMVIAIRPPADTYEEYQLFAAQAPTQYGVRIDGLRAAVDYGDGEAHELFAMPGTTGLSLPAGSHRFELTDSDGHVVLSGGPFDILPGSGNRLIVFGAETSFQHRFFYDTAPAAGFEAFLVVNLLGGGDPIEVVSCVADSGDPQQETCSAISSRSLAYGDSYGATVPSEGLETTGSSSLAYGYRRVVSGPTPTPVRHLMRDPVFWHGIGHPMVLFNAPIFFGPADGECPYCVGGEL